MQPACEPALRLPDSDHERSPHARSVARSAPRRSRLSWLRALWQLLHGRLWFVPAVVVSACIALALLLIEAHGWGDVNLAQRWPRLFGAGSDGARSMLTAIATSMATVAGVVFSVTIVALSLASTQYSPRVLGNFMNDRPTQFVPGVFVGVFAYCLVVLRTVRGHDSGEAFLPSYAVLGGVVLALFGVAMLIYFIHHVAASIQASSIVERIANDTADAIDALFPQPIGAAVAEPPPRADERFEPRWVLTARRTGYLVGVDDDGLLEFAVQHDCEVHLARRIGDFVIEGQPLARRWARPRASALLRRECDKEISSAAEHSTLCTPLIESRE